jgi:ABC-2 type transport system permease protein
MRFLRYLRLARLLARFKLNRQMIYSVNFWMAFFVDTTVFGIQMAVFAAMFLQVDSINGWNKYQMIFFVGTFTIIDSLYMSSFFFGVISIPEKIRTGKLDIYITKPINTLFFVSFESMDIGSLMLTVPGMMMVGYSVKKLGLTLNLWNVSGYIFFIGIMLVLMYDLMVILRSLAFWFIKTDALMEFENEMMNFSFRIPGIVFKGASKLIFYVILPYALLATIPTQFFTTGLTLQDFILTMGVCIAFTFLSQIIWRTGLKHYSSASS